MSDGARVLVVITLIITGAFIASFFVSRLLTFEPMEMWWQMPILFFSMIFGGMLASCYFWED